MKHRPSQSGPESTPARLLDGDSALAELLRLESERAPPSGASFEVLSGRRKRRQLRQMVLWTAAFALPVGLLTLAAHRDSLEISAEHQPSRIAAEGAPPASPRQAAQVPSAWIDASATNPESLASLPSAPIESAARQAAPFQAGPAAPRRADTKAYGGLRTPAPQAPGSARSEERALNVVDCASASRGGDYELAMGCYDERARGEGTSAELSLLEAARIAWRALRSTERALARLDEYDRRFQKGALRREAALLRVEVLYSTSDVNRQRAAIERALILVPERSKELRKQAIEMAVRTGDCAAAREHIQAIIGSGNEEAEALHRTLESCGPAASPPAR